MIPRIAAKQRHSVHCVGSPLQSVVPDRRDATRPGAEPAGLRRVGPILGLAAALVLSASFAGEPVKPICLHPKNPHYFLWRGEPTILVTSGEHYGALLNLDFDYARYFDELEAIGLNHTRTFSGSYREIPSSFGITDNPLVALAGRAYLAELAGTRVRFFRYGEGFLHQKVMLIDDDLATVGTANLDNRSMRLNFEHTMVLADHGLARTVEAMLIQDLARSTEVDMSSLARDPWWQRATSRGARLLAPVL